MPVTPNRIATATIPTLDVIISLPLLSGQGFGWNPLLGLINKVPVHREGFLNGEKRKDDQEEGRSPDGVIATSQYPDSSRLRRHDAILKE
jgi:hypothetical protein